MKNMMAFMKKRWPLIVAILVILVALPMAWVFSGKLNDRIKRTQENAANNLMTRLDGLKVTYELPAPYEGMEPVIERGVMPHPRLTEFFRQEQQLQSERLAEATQEIIDFNSKGRGVLVEGLFPEQPEDDSEAQLMRLRMQDLLIPGDGDSAYERLLESIGATMPPEPQSVLDQLNDTRARLFERESAQSGTTEMDPEEQEAMEQELSAQRVSLYARPAQENSIYMSLDVLPEGSPFQVAPGFPRQARSNTPNHGLTFLWQLDFWLAQDLFGFLGEANSRGGELLPIVEAPIKRVLRIEGRPLRLDRVSGQGEYPEPVDQGPDPSAQLFEPRFYTSPSGRQADWLNQLYDIRQVQMSMVVDSARIPEIIDAAARYNLITVTDLDIKPVDVWNDLERGYYYGPDHVVQLDVELELVYLRAWTAPLMPNVIRQELGLEPHPEPEEDMGFDEDPGLG
ncbi:MAG: hypothetical protein ACIAS6_12610 [Phycisphaerales bacterium JB060]